MIPIRSSLISRVKSESTVKNIHRNITLHGDSGGGEVVKLEGKRGRRKEKGGDGGGGGESLSAAEVREAAIQEREAAEKEVEKLRNIVKRLRKDLKARMVEVSRAEAERKRMLDERSKKRHKQVMLDAYYLQCEEAEKIFAEYHKCLYYYVNQARDSQRLSVDSSLELVSSFSSNSEKEAVYSTLRGSKAADDVFLIETTRERNIWKACESLAAHMIEKIRNSFPVYEGSGIHSNPQLEAAKLGFKFDGELPEEVRGAILNGLKSPPQLLQAITSYTLRLKSLISREL